MVTKNLLIVVSLLNTLKLSLALLKELLLGSSKILFLALSQLVKLLFRLNRAELAFIGLLVISGILLAGGFLGYTVFFEAERATYHTIVTDDFLWFFIFHAIAFLPIVIELLYPICSSQELRVAFSLRVIGLGGISLLYLLSLLNPQRISPTLEANFTINFYVFAGVNLALWASGILGIVRYAQNSHKT